MDQNTQQGPQALVDAEFEGLFIEGYFASRAKAGERPTYGYPANHLPEATGSMELKTSFLA